MNKQTAVEWLFKEIYGETGHIGSYTTHGKDAFEALEKAKAMEREQIEHAFDVGYGSASDAPPVKYPHLEYHEASEYYNETYKGGEQ